MAPKRKQSTADGPPASTRVTRSSTRRANPNDNSTAAPEKPAPKKKVKTAAPAAAEAAEVKAQSPPEVLDGNGSKSIVIEHCKQCNSFKTRALAVKVSLEKEVPGVKVVVNPEKPRRGCFEIREEGGAATFVSLLDMKRPFKPMKDLDMTQVVSEIVEKIK